MSGNTAAEELAARDVSKSLMGLLGAFDHLKEAVGYSKESAEFAAIDHFVREIEAENSQLTSHAVDAIQVAERLKEENQQLLDELMQLKMTDMVAQTHVLNAVAVEYDKDLVEAQLAAAQAVVDEVENLRERVMELEDENSGLKQTVRELRETQQQLRRLQVVDQTNTAALGASSRTNATIKPNEAQNRVLLETSDSDVKQQTEKHKTVAGKFGDDNATDRDPTHVAEALEAIAGGSNDGLVARAARMLHEYASVQQSLKEQRASNEKLTTEIAELNEMMTAKTFKAPSAWAEREVKYKQDKRRWEEEQKAANVQIEQLCRELEDLQSNTGYNALQRRIEDLEARLVESERDRVSARAALHDLELASRASEGEFSTSGVKPYRGPRPGADGEVNMAVERIESSSGTPTRPSPVASASGDNAVTPAHMGASLGVSGEYLTPTENVSQTLAALQRENTRLRAQLEKLGTPDVGVLETPQIVREALNSSTSKRARELEAELEQIRRTKSQSLEELESLRRAQPLAAGGSSSHNNLGGQKGPAPADEVINGDVNPVTQIRIQELESLLVATSQEEQRVRNNLEALAPTKLRFGVQEGPPEVVPGTGFSRRSSEGSLSLDMFPEKLARDRAEVEAAWEDHQKNSDVSNLLRAKLELETQCNMLETQLERLQESLASAERDHLLMKELIERAVLSGNVAPLLALRNGPLVQLPDSDLVARGGEQISTENVTSSALVAPDSGHVNGGKSFKWRLTRMSKKFERRNKATEATTVNNSEIGQIKDSGDGTSHVDQVAELTSLRDENQMLMEHLVTTKVRLAEVEGDFLESRRALLRSREKQMQLARQLMAAQAVEGEVNSGKAPVVRTEEPKGK